MVPEAIAAHDLLGEQGVFVNVFNVTGPGPLYANFQATSLAAAKGTRVNKNLFDELVPTEERSAPVVTVADAHPHSLAWIGSALGTRLWPLGVTSFGQSGRLRDVYQSYHIDTCAIVTVCRSALESAAR
jgi:pyruvate dehydrogenase E1 component